MRILLPLGGLVVFHAMAATPAPHLWNELKSLRENLAAAHQEFDVTQTFQRQADSQGTKRRIVLDLSGKRWREQVVSGSGIHIRIFDGTELFSVEEGGGEFVRTRHRAKEDDPAPAPYLEQTPDWSKAVELERRPCGFTGNEHSCVVLEVALKPWSRRSPSRMTRMVKGTARMAIDTETGLLLSLSTAEAIQSPTAAYQKLVNYAVKRMSYGAAAELDAGLFTKPAGDLREVKEFTRWDATAITKNLAGKPAPELSVTDMQGRAITLGELKGKIVLLDFWTTWCPPCRKDAPALDKLYSKYGDKDLAIVGISVGEDRAIVAQYLQRNPHKFPTVLSLENDLAHAYQIGALPTYIVIDREGTLTAAAQGDQGFSELRRLLKRAGVEVE